MMNSSFIDGTIYCKFSRDVNTVIENEIFDLSNDKYFLLLAAGNSLKGKYSFAIFNDILVLT